MSKKLLAKSLTSNTRIKFLSRFVRQLSALSRVGLPFLTSLQIMADETRHPIYREAFTKLRHDIALGESLTNAISKQGHLFPPLLVQMTVVAEAAGSLVEVYDNLGDTYDRELELRRKVAGAAAYPALVLLLALLGAIVVSKFALPQLEELLAYSTVPLPMPTRILLYVGQPGPWYRLSFLFGFLVLALFIFLLTPIASGIRDLILLRVPWVGSLVLRFHLARTCHVLSLCLSSGIPLLAALDIAGQASLSKSLATGIQRLKAGAQVGLGLTNQLRTMKAAPNFLVQMVRVGEETGRMPEMLQQAGDILDKDLWHALEMAVTWLEPLLILVAGFFVAFAVFGILMPLLALIDSLG